MESLSGDLISFRNLHAVLAFTVAKKKPFLKFFLVSNYSNEQSVVQCAWFCSMARLPSLLESFIYISDFHCMGTVRRGQIGLSISTGRITLLRLLFKFELNLFKSHYIPWFACDGFSFFSLIHLSNFCCNLYQFDL